MRLKITAIAIAAFVCASCSKNDGKGPPKVEYGSEAEAEAARASYEKGKAWKKSRPLEKGDPGARVELAAPQPSSPADGSEFNQSPRTTVLKWGTVTGAALYKVEVEYQSPETGEWREAVPVKEIAATEYEFEFNGAHPGRWRVWAVDANGREGPKSAWWMFRYTQ